MLFAVLCLTSVTLLAQSQQADNFSQMEQEQFIENDTGPTVTITLNANVAIGEEVGLVLLQEHGYVFRSVSDDDAYNLNSVWSVKIYRSDSTPRIAGATAGGFGDKRGTGRQV